MEHNLENISKKFQIEGTFDKISPFHVGHINDTFFVETKEQYASNYLLQLINTKVFTDVEKLTANIVAITNHIKNKLSQIPGADPDRETLTLVPTLDGKNFYTEAEGYYWRMFTFIENTKAFSRIDFPKQAYQTAKTFGNFLRLIADLPTTSLYEIIPNFHNIEKRIEAFEVAIQEDSTQRVASVQEEIDFLLQRTQDMTKIVRLGNEGKIPLRVIHNNPKLNHILFDEFGDGLCIVDLDAVMAGYIVYDFGDGIRTAASTSNENEQDLSKVALNLSFFESYTKGFLEEVKDAMNINEVENLAFGAKLLTYEQAVRFLTDYIDGDNYYKILYPEHNLVRARNQIQLLKSMEEQFDKMEVLVRKIANR